MKKQSDFLYELSNNLMNEIIYGLDDTDELTNILEGVEEYYVLPNIPENVSIKKKHTLGNYAFYLLDLPDLPFDSEINCCLRQINSFLASCIEKVSCCNEKMFLVFVRYILKIQNIPEAKSFATYNNDIPNAVYLQEMLESVTMEDIEVSRTYLCKNVVDLVIASVYEILSKGFRIKRCRNCHKYFFTKNSNKYCPYRSPQDETKSCYDYCNKMPSQQKRKEDPIQSKYTQVSNMLRSRCNYHDRESDWKLLGDFAEDYRNRKSKLDAGLISKEDVMNFLNSSDRNFRNQYKKERKVKKNGSQGTNQK